MLQAILQDMNSNKFKEMIDKQMEEYNKELYDINVINIDDQTLNIFYNTSVQSNSFINLRKDIDRILNLDISTLFDMKASITEYSFNFCKSLNFTYIKIYCIDKNGITIFMNKSFPLHKDILEKILFILTRFNCYVSKYRDDVEQYIKDNKIQNTLIYY